MNIVISTLDEVERIKNDTIREIQAELKKIREAHSNMVKTYEGKLSEFGIPVEELGFDPLVPANIWSCLRFTLKLQIYILSLICQFTKNLEEPGFEPGAFRMRSECDTTTPHSLIHRPDIASFSLAKARIIIHSPRLNQNQRQFTAISKKYAFTNPNKFYLNKILN